MSSNALFLLIVLPFLFFGCQTEVPGPESEINLSGQWIGLEYQCPFGVFHNEVVEITHTGADIQAVKITGDPCVPARNITFSGNFDSKTKRGSITWTTGWPNDPACCTTTTGTINYEECKLKATSSSSELITFTRIDGNEAVNYDVPVGVPLVAQPNNLSCWAASMTMMISWRDNTSYTIENALSTIGVFWINRFNMSPPSINEDELPILMSTVGMQSVQFTPSIKGFEELLEENGPLWIGLDGETGPAVAAHVVIVTGIHGDGTPECTYVNINNPGPVGVGSTYIESYEDFYDKISQIMDAGAAISIHHW